MKATLLSLVSLAPIALFVSCTPNQGQVGDPVAPAANTGNPYGVPTAPDAAAPTAGNPYGVPGAPAPGAYPPANAPYQPVEPINPPAVPSAPTYTPTAPTIPTAPTGPALNGNVHTIQKGDSLWGIARKHGTSVEALKEANGMTGDTIIEGRTLIIPGR